MVDPRISTAPSIRDQLIRDAQNLPDLIEKARVFDPELYDALTGQAATVSATPVGAVAAAVLAWVVTHYGLGWDQDSINLVSGLAIVCGGYVTHYVQAWLTKAPLTSTATGGAAPKT